MSACHVKPQYFFSSIMNLSSRDQFHQQIVTKHKSKRIWQLAEKLQICFDNTCAEISQDYLRVGAVKFV